MKTVTYAVIMTLATAGFAVLAGTYVVKDLRKKQSLEMCAKSLNVYKCRWVAVPVEAPRVVVQQADILPPPVL